MIDDGHNEFSAYTKAELEEGLRRVDPAPYPKNYHALTEALAEVAPTGSSPSSLEVAALQRLNAVVTADHRDRVNYAASLLLFLGLIAVSYWSQGHVKTSLIPFIMSPIALALLALSFGVTYRFEGGAMTCLRFGRPGWTESLSNLEYVQEKSIASFPVLRFHWKDHARTVYLAAADFQRHAQSTVPPAGPSERP